MTKKNFVLKTLSCIIIVAVLFYYNQMMKLNEELVQANTKIEQMAGQENSGGDAASAAEPGPYKDGTYSGTAQGYGGPVTTQVIITNGNITGIEITSSDGEDAAYYNMCLGILDDIVATQGTEVDTVSGATYTSNGIIGGAAEALSQAAKS